MPFDLHVTFGGICMLTPDAVEEKLQVFLPHAGDHADPTEHHIARLFYDRGHADRHGTATGLRGPLHALENRLLDMSGLVPGARPTGTAPADVVDVASIVGEPLDRTLLDGDGNGRVLSRVVLGGGKATWSNPGGIWKIAGQAPRRMAIQVTWTVSDVPGDSLTLKLQPLTGSGSAETLELYPFAGQGGERTLHLYVFHTPAYEIQETLPPPMSPLRPGVGQEARHFRFYYGLFDDPPHPAPLPIYVGDGQEPPAVDEGAEPNGTMMMCIVGTGTMQEE